VFFFFFFFIFKRFVMGFFFLQIHRGGGRVGLIN
jgi:hypothetical protein